MPDHCDVCGHSEHEGQACVASLSCECGPVRVRPLALVPLPSSDLKRRRDAFAAAALQGLLASYAFEGATIPRPGTLAVQAWAFADAMLAAEKEAKK